MRTSIILLKGAFLFLVLSAAIGLLMRWQFIAPMGGFNYQYLLHTHSHVILLGWVFNALIAGFHYMLFKDETTKKHVILYLLFQVSVVGMLFSFPVQGYAAISISFSTLHILLSYIWAGWVWKRSISLTFEVRIFLRWGLIYLLISTLGPFSLGPIIVSGNAGSDMYYMAIYYYLHFLYNGFFMFTIIGMFLWTIREKGFQLDKTKVKKIVILMNIQCIAGLALSALWMQPHLLIYVIGAVAGLIQVLALIQLVRLKQPIWKDFTSKISQAGILLLKWSFVGLVMKILLQAVSAVPFIADLAYEVRNYTIGYLHLVFLGVVTPFLIGWFDLHGMIFFRSRLKNFGLLLFFTGFVLSEFVLVTSNWWDSSYYFKLLFATSAVLLTGIILLFPLNKVADSRIIGRRQ